MALERRAFLQAMVSRPLVAATVTGLLCEDVLAGLWKDGVSSSVGAGSW